MGRVLRCLIVIALSACSLTLPPPRDATGDASLTRMDPVSRLGRWDGERFVEVHRGELPPSHLRVLVHGWTPGGDRIAARCGTRIWELAESDPAGEPWMAELARMFTEQDPYSVVLAYSWLDDSSTVRAPLAERMALSYTQQHGEILARALRDGLASDFTAENGGIHLLGHSYGARVAAVAAVHMHLPPAQLTLFDGPDAGMVYASGSATRLVDELDELPVGWGAGSVFVDNYVSMVGRRYSHLAALAGMVDVVLAPPFAALAYRPRHLYPMAFYARSPGTGFGYDWSPMTANARRPTEGCWAQIPGPEQLGNGEPYGTVLDANELVLRYGCDGVP